MNHRRSREEQEQDGKTKTWRIYEVFKTFIINHFLMKQKTDVWCRKTILLPNERASSSELPQKQEVIFASTSIIHAAFGLSVRHGPFTESPVNLLAVNRRVPRLEISSFRDSEEDGGQWREPGSTLIRALVNMLSKQANMIWTRNPRFINFESEKFSDERARLTLYVKTHPCQAEMRQ